MVSLIGDGKVCSAVYGSIGGAGDKVGLVERVSDITYPPFPPSETLTRHH